MQSCSASSCFGLTTARPGPAQRGAGSALDAHLRAAAAERGDLSTALRLRESAEADAEFLPPPQTCSRMVLQRSTPGDVMHTNASRSFGAAFAAQRWLAATPACRLRWL